MSTPRIFLIAIATIFILAACGNSDSEVQTKPDPLAETASDYEPAVVSADPLIVTSLEELVDASPIIVIGEVQEEAEVINTVRLAEDPSKPDPYFFGVGQVYRVKVEEYLKGSGPSNLNVVNQEGYLTSRDGPVSPPTSKSDIDRIKRAYQDYHPLRQGERYLFFVRSATGFDPSLNYVGMSLGSPWRFTLPKDGHAWPDTPFEEALALYPAMPSAELIDLVISLTPSRT